MGEFAASRHGVFTRQQAVEHQLHRNVIARLLRAGHLREPVPGVSVVHGSVNSWQQRLIIATSASNNVADTGVASAARLHRFDGFAKADGA